MNSFAEGSKQLIQLRDDIMSLIKSLSFHEAMVRFAEAEELLDSLKSRAATGNQIQIKIIGGRELDLELLNNDILDGLGKRAAGKKEDGNIAFKCNWNDAGYKGVCSGQTYKYNLIHGRSWCKVSRCRDYVNIHPVPVESCYEAVALRDCLFGAGWDHDEKGHMKNPRRIWSAREGKISILTTEPPGKPRLVVGAYKIEQVMDDPKKETFILGNKSLVLDNMLPLGIKFWDHYKNPVKPLSMSWASGLFRYVADATAFSILEEYLVKINDTQYEKIARELIDSIIATNKKLGK